MQKNTASQKWRVFAFDRTTQVPKTGDAANITAVIKIDGGASTATNDANPTEISGGYYEFDLTQAETNGNEILLIPTSVTANVQVIGCPALQITTPASWNNDIVQTGDSYARIGAAGVGLTNLGDTRIANLDTTVSSRLAPAGTLANVTTVNGLANGVITAASIAADAITDAKVASDVTIASVTGSVGSVTGVVTANVTKSVGYGVMGYGTVDTGASTTSVPTSACTPAGSVVDQFVDRVMIFASDTTTAALRGVAKAITASTNASNPTFTVGTLPATPAAGDTFVIV